jgi:hypothetical protein
VGLTPVSAILEICLPGEGMFLLVLGVVHLLM